MYEAFHAAADSRREVGIVMSQGTGGMTKTLEKTTIAAAHDHQPKQEYKEPEPRRSEHLAPSEDGNRFRVLVRQVVRQLSADRAGGGRLERSETEPSGNGAVAGPFLVGVTSCLEGEGVSTVAGNLVSAARQVQGLNPVLLDTKPGRGSDDASAHATLPNAARFVRYLAGPDGRTAAAISTNGGSGKGGHPADSGSNAPDDAASVPRVQFRASRNGLDANVFWHVLGSLQQEFNFLVVDLPTVSDVGVCLELVGMCDGVLLVVEAERAPAPRVLRGKRRIDQADGNLLGVVLNKIRHADSE